MKIGWGRECERYVESVHNKETKGFGGNEKRIDRE